MRRRSFIAMAAAAGVAAMSSAACARPAGVTSRPAPTSRTEADASQPASLRGLAQKVGLRIGTAAIPQDLETPAYAAILASQFSAVTPGDEMKWQVVEPRQGVFDWSAADNLVAFAEQHGQLVRGHTLVWQHQLPDWLTTGVANGIITDSQLKDLLQKHIQTEVGRYAGRIWQWDVCNEFFTDSNPAQLNPDDFWISHLGVGVIADAFRWAHEADPNALLFYNDYNIAGEDGSNAKSDAVYAFLQQLMSEGVPIHGVGVQGHLDTQWVWNPGQMASDLRRFANLGLRVAITEADVRTAVDNPTSQLPTDNLSRLAQPYLFSEMMKACLAVPQCISFSVWGFTDADSWIPDYYEGEGYATLYDVSLNPKPAYDALQRDLELAAFGAPHRREG